jgi:RND family efflux transporter MFP subunit
MIIIHSILTAGIRAGVRRIIVAALVPVVAGACKRGDNANAAEVAATSPAVTVGPENIAVAQRAELHAGPAISGSLEPEWSATIRAEVAGPVVATYAEQGQRVARGAPLARIDDSAIRDAYLSAQSGVRSAQTAADLATRNAERNQTLEVAGAIAERDLEQARASAQSARAALADAQARLTQAEKQLEKTQVRAPAAGVVSSREVQAGDVVQVGGAMFTIVDPSRMKLEASVPAAQLGSVRVGAPVEFSVTGYGGRTFIGRVARINPVVDPATGQVRIYVAIPNAGGSLVGGLFTQGRVTSETRTGTVVPATAVNQRGLRPTVTRVRSGKAEQVEVELGLQDQATERVEIARGIAPGDTILVGAAQGIGAGTPIRVSAPHDQVARE